MNQTLKDYTEARVRFNKARKTKTEAETEYESARYQFMLAKRELRAEEEEMLFDKVQ